MRVLLISSEGYGASMIRVLQREGCDVRFLVVSENVSHRRLHDGLVEKVSTLDEGLRWIKKDGLILFDDASSIASQDRLRKKGYRVVGGSDAGDVLENDRDASRKLFESCGMRTLPQHRFLSLYDAVEFLGKTPGPWVIKQNGQMSKTLNYVGHERDNTDTIAVLKKYIKTYGAVNNAFFDLQKRVRGIEISAARYFNGRDWVGPIEINLEHKDFFSHLMGPKTDEMGSLMWYTDNKNIPLYQRTIAQTTQVLRDIDFRGSFCINCIVNASGIYPLEVTARFGYPAFQAQTELHKSSWVEFFDALAGSRSYDLSWKNGYSAVVLIAAPPFPFRSVRGGSYDSSGLPVVFRESSERDFCDHVHLESVRRDSDGTIIIADDDGIVLYVSAHAKTAQEARKKVYARAKKIIVPKGYYRKDIGLAFVRYQAKQLKKWGYV